MHLVPRETRGKIGIAETVLAHFCTWKYSHACSGFGSTAPNGIALTGPARCDSGFITGQGVTAGLLLAKV